MCMSLYGCYTFSILNGMNVIKQKYSTWRLCIIVYRRKNKCFQNFYCFIYLFIYLYTHSYSIINWLFFFSIQCPSLLSSLDPKHIAPKAEDSFLVRLGKWKMRVAQAKCIIRMDRMPAYQGEGKEKDGCKYVFQISLKVYFLLWVNMY